jgi:lipopolysaccharide/colanic/teichoic acid biosynthesis glycosyltransferase
MEEENKTKDELLKEVKELKEEIKRDNKEKKQSRTSTDMMLAGIGLVILAIIMFWLAKGCGIL